MKIGFSSKTKVESQFDIDKFKLKKEEVARVCCLDQEVVVKVGHWVSVPQGDQRMGYHDCLGRYDIIYGTDTLPAQGRDVEMCAFCRNAVQNGVIGLPARRLGMNIIQYLTDNKGELRKPPMFDVKVWIFGDDKYGRLTDIVENNKLPSLRFVDLKVKCTGEKFQKFEIDLMNECVWLAGSSFAQNQISDWSRMVLEKFKADRTDDTVLLASMTKSHTKETAERIVSELLGITAGADIAAVPTTGADIQALLDGVNKQPAAPVSKPVLVPHDPQPVPAPVPAPPAQSGQTPQSFEELLNFKK